MLSKYKLGPKCVHSLASLSLHSALVCCSLLLPRPTVDWSDLTNPRTGWQLDYFRDKVAECARQRCSKLPVWHHTTGRKKDERVFGQALCKLLNQRNTVQEDFLDIPSKFLWSHKKGGHTGFLLGPVDWKSVWTSLSPFHGKDDANTKSCYSDAAQEHVDQCLRAGQELRPCAPFCNFALLKNYESTCHWVGPAFDGPAGEAADMTEARRDNQVRCTE